MPAPGGFCEFCGSVNKWCFHFGELFVHCPSGCLSLFDVESVSLPPVGEESPGIRSFADWERSREERVIPLEGGAAKPTDLLSKRLEEPPRDFLRSLWEGDHGEESRETD